MKVYVTTAMVDLTELPRSHWNQNRRLDLNKRILEYEYNFKKLKEFDIDFTIIETVKSKSEFLESHGKVIYTNINNPNYLNRGTNYVNAFRTVVNKEDINSDELVIHLTGRYPLVSRSFFDECELLEDDEMACIKRDSYGQVYCFLYGIRKDLHLSILNSIDLNYFDTSMVNLESIIRDKLYGIRVRECEKLGITGNQSSLDDQSYGKITF